MAQILSMKEENFWKLGFQQHNGNWFKDRGADILAVAHLDSVQPFTHVKFLKLRNQTRVYCPTLDDRLGAYMIIHELADLPYDILLTTNEEKCMSTAAQFIPPRQYNWMFEFDRGGFDVVMYNYGSIEMEKLLEAENFEVGFGSYTDICELYNLNCKGFNFGVGYYDYHSRNAYANLTGLAIQAKKFRSFFEKHKDTHFPHDNTELYEETSVCHICSYENYTDEMLFFLTYPSQREVCVCEKCAYQLDLYMDDDFVDESIITELINNHNKKEVSRWLTY